MAVDGDVAVAIGRAVLLNLPWPPPGVPDDDETRGLRDTIAAQAAELTAQGITPDLPTGWTSS